MERILIIGCGGAGKSTLARQLGEKLELPVVHLDKLFWKPGWVEESSEEFDRKLAIELEKTRWIMDGNFNRTMPQRLSKCDTIIYLDFSRWQCLRGWIGRVIKNWGHARADMAPGCNEWFDPEMAGWIWNFNRKNRAGYYEILSRAEGKRIVILKSRREAGEFLKKLEM